MNCFSGEGKTRNVLPVPYHAWTYNLDGALINRAAIRASWKISIAMKFASIRCRIEVFCHLVFVNLDPDAGTVGRSKPATLAQRE